MKKIIFLMAFALIGSISMAEATPNVEEDIFGCCTVSVSYNGVFVDSFSGCGPTGCSIARAKACAFIEGWGGTCPNMQ